MKKYRTTPLLLVLTLALLACDGGSPLVNSCLDTMESVVEGYEQAARKEPVSTQDQFKNGRAARELGRCSLAMASEEQTDAQLERAFELGARMQKALLGSLAR
jgi:hypothetical protein